MELARVMMTRESRGGGFTPETVLEALEIVLVALELQTLSHLLSQLLQLYHVAGTNALLGEVKNEDEDEG